MSTLGFFGRSARGIDVTNDIFSTGARQISSLSDLEKFEKEAADFYENIRTSNSSYDVSRISKNTGIPEYRIQTIKNHLFFNTHQLPNDVIGYFDSDIEVADAWRRLQTGTFHQQDINLLNHEYFETRFEGIFNTSYQIAHEASLNSGRVWDPEEIPSPNQSSYWRP